MTQTEIPYEETESSRKRGLAQSSCLKSSQLKKAAPQGAGDAKVQDIDFSSGLGAARLGIQLERERVLYRFSFFSGVVVMKTVLILAALLASTACTTLSNQDKSQATMSSENQKAVIEATEILK